MDKHDPISPAQAGNRPGSEIDQAFDRPAAIRKVLSAHPMATVDEVIDLLARQQIDVSATLVFQEMERLRRAGGSR